MDLQAIKAKLATLSSNNNDREKVDYEKVFWKPTTGKHQIRILPSIYNPTFPFTELLFHYGIGKYPMIALSNFGKQDPIEEFIKELKKTSDKDNWSLAGKLTPKTRIFAPVVVRGEEDRGVRLWGFGKTIYKALLSLAEDEDVGDFTDPVNGFDMIVEQTPGNPYPETTVRLKPKMSALSGDLKLVENWLKEQPDPKATFTQYDYDFVKRQLQKYLSPEAEEENPTPPVTVPDIEDDALPPFITGTNKPEKEHFSMKAPAEKKKSAASTFDDLFD